MSICVPGWSYQGVSSMATHRMTGSSVTPPNALSDQRMLSLLGYLFRATSGGIMRVAGLAPVENIPGLENFNVTSLVNGHMAYRTAMPRLLREVGWEVESEEFTEIEDPDPENHEKRQRELIREIDEARKYAQSKPEKKRFGFFKRGKLAEKKGWETYDDSAREAGLSPTKPDDGSTDVLFDIEAIKAELASEQIEVKQLESTLPPMRVSLNGSSDPTSRPQSNPHTTLRETKSYDASLQHRPEISRERSQSSLPNGHARNPFNQGYDKDIDQEDDATRFATGEDVKMSFDHPDLSPRMSIDHSQQSPLPFKIGRSSTASPDLVPPQEESAMPSPPQRPAIRSSLPIPSGSSALTVEHNAWLMRMTTILGRRRTSR